MPLQYQYTATLDQSSQQACVMFWLAIAPASVVDAEHCREKEQRVLVPVHQYSLLLHRDAATRTPPCQFPLLFLSHLARILREYGPELIQLNHDLLQRGPLRVPSIEYCATAALLLAPSGPRDAIRQTSSHELSIPTHRLLVLLQCEQLPRPASSGSILLSQSSVSCGTSDSRAVHCRITRSKLSPESNQHRIDFPYRLVGSTAESRYEYLRAAPSSWPDR